MLTDRTLRATARNVDRQTCAETVMLKRITDNYPIEFFHSIRVTLSIFLQSEAAKPWMSRIVAP